MHEPVQVATYTKFKSMVTASFAQSVSCLTSLPSALEFSCLAPPGDCQLLTVADCPIRIVGGIVQLLTGEHLKEKRRGNVSTPRSLLFSCGQARN